MEKKSDVNDKVLSKERSQNIKISVCIPTYKRIPLLEKLLNSINGQILPANVILEIIVVDNDAEKTAEEVVKEFSKTSQYECMYFSQPVKNISITRNMAVKNASGDYILFIDDDNYASPNLIKEHLEALNKYNADLVFGLVKPEFHPNTPEWMKDKDFYYSPIGESGSNAKFTCGANIFIKSFILKQFDEPFDVAYGITGGEDSYLYNKLAGQGYKLKTSREAVSIEFIPPERTTLRYLFQRAFKGGNSYVRRVAELNPNKKILIYLEQFIKGTIQALFYSIKLIFVFFSRNKRIKSLQKIYANLGKLFAISGYKYEGYK